MEIRRNRFTFGFGTVGRDMVYSMVSMYLIFYLTDIVELSTAALWWVTAVVFAARVFDAFNDPVMGVIVDNTHTRFGKFKPWIAFGAVTAGILTVLIFTDFGLEGAAYTAVFGILYILWGVCFTTNDIAYWSMMPALRLAQKEREKIGSAARIFANIGLFFVVAGIVPITNALGETLGSMQKGYFAFSAMIVAIMWAGQCVTLFGVREPSGVFRTETQHTSLKGMVKVIFGNDQLLVTAVSMALFMIGYTILGISQIIALLVFPVVSKFFERKRLYAVSTALVLAGYVIFFFAPTGTMAFIGVAGVLLFVGQAFIQLMMLMFLADTVEYGFWKSGKRNDSVTFALQPFINKLGGAVASGIVSVTVIISGIKDARSAADVTPAGLFIMKTAMMVLPLLCIVAGFIFYSKKYKIDCRTYEKILQDLKDRGDIEG